mmetsp:Transcript_42139/g.66819  ORF Transcript_42139/g.66819 Transcript_42139/m.66819 type:complete len:241 (+) Transcript_42139:95-817(+)
MYTTEPIFNNGPPGTTTTMISTPALASGSTTSIAPALIPAAPYGRGFSTNVSARSAGLIRGNPFADPALSGRMLPSTSWMANGQMVATKREQWQRDIENQYMSQQLWESHEKDLTRRVTHLENLIRRSVELQAVDVEKERKEERRTQLWQSQEQIRTHATPFNQIYYGPVQGQFDGQAPNNPGYYMEPEKAVLQATVDHEEANRIMTWRQRNPVTMALAGDYKYLKHDLCLDDGNDGLYY